jgi:ActR/RegA family two-component response regulator
MILVTFLISDDDAVYRNREKRDVGKRGSRVEQIMLTV